MEVILLELLNTGRLSPLDLNVSANILNFLVRDWKSKEILVNNRFIGCVHESLRKLQSEIGEWLEMWDGGIQHVLWLFSSPPDVARLAWEEMLSRMEHWFLKKHPRYAYKCLNTFHRLLVGCKTKNMDSVDLKAMLLDRQFATSFEAWSRGISEEIPDIATERSQELRVIWDLSCGISNPRDDEYTSKPAYRISNVRKY